MESRTVDDSQVQMTEMVMPEDTNDKGSVFGGRILALIDKCAGIAAMRHSNSVCVTASFDSVDFLNPARVGDILSLTGQLTAAFSTSMEIEVEVWSENPIARTRQLTTTAYVTMVAVDGNFKPRSCAPLKARNDDERKRAEAAATRRRQRLENRSQA